MLTSQRQAVPVPVAAVLPMVALVRATVQRQVTGRRSVPNRLPAGIPRVVVVGADGSLLGSDNASSG